MDCFGLVAKSGTWKWFSEVSNIADDIFQIFILPLSDV